MTNLNNVAFGNTQDWTTEQLISLSNNLASAYGCGFNQPVNSKQDENWTVERLVNLSQSFAYPLCF